MKNEIKLRALEKDDLEFLHKLNNDPDVMDYWFSEPYMTMEKLKESYEKSLEHTHHRQFILTKDKERLGFIGLYGIDQKHRNAEFGIMIDPEHQGKGYAKSATQLALDYAFIRLNLHKVYLTVDTENKKAIHIYEKAGFQVEGEMKEHFFVNGSYHDAMSMCMISRDYFETEGQVHCPS